ncbi:hypothetical protein CBR_g36544 [Chara braunii]|uniref:Kinesin motor domain-containing protein n=1 Tax=Chara braunii TaxID=69332 RepID=A0A388JZ13_CHABU|nr:hypothetical protein CBR_g36544 [Chara braunii]|eukprot:GBG63061.1 hypothetical protein CBR_g36544 [Chara braunii]
MVASAEYVVSADHQSVPSPASFAMAVTDSAVPQTELQTELRTELPAELQTELSAELMAGDSNLSQSPSLPVDREIKEVISTEPTVGMKRYWDSPHSPVLGVHHGLSERSVRASWAGGTSDGMGPAGPMMPSEEPKPMDRRCVVSHREVQKHDGGKTRSDIIMASRRAEEAACRRQHAMQWMQMMTGADLPLDPSEEDFRKVLKNGVLLCELINRMQPGSVPKVCSAFLISSFPRLSCVGSTATPAGALDAVPVRQQGETMMAFLARLGTYMQRVREEQQREAAAETARLHAIARDAEQRRRQHAEAAANHNKARKDAASVLVQQEAAHTAALQAWNVDPAETTEPTAEEQTNSGDEPDGPSFVIEIPPHLTVHPDFHASKMATYTPAKSDDFQGRRLQDPPSMDGHQEVDRVITQRKHGNKPMQYKVSFKWCDREHMRWISQAALQASTPDIYADYEKKWLATEAAQPPIRTSVPPSNRQLRPCRDVRFTSVLWKAAAAEQGTQLQMTSGNHPEANGQAEKLNCAIIQDPASPMDSTHAVFQSFENIRNFLAATEALGIPGFLASDLEQESPLVSGTTTRIVECVLGLKALCDYRQQNGPRPMPTNGNPGWKYVPPGNSRSGSSGMNRGSPLSTPLMSPLSRSRSSVRQGNAFYGSKGGAPCMRRSLIFPDIPGYAELANDLGTDLQYEEEWRESGLHHHHHHHHHLQQQPMVTTPGGGTDNSVISAAVVTVSGHGLTAGAGTLSRSMSMNAASIDTGGWEKIHGCGMNGEEVSAAARLINITQTLRDQLHKARSEPIVTTPKETRAPISQLLSSMMKGDSCPEQVVRRVELMMTTMLQEFDRRLLMKDEHIAKMREIMTMMKREDEHAAENRILEALALGATEESKESKNGYEEDRRRLTEDLIRAELERERSERTARDAMEALQRVKIEAEQQRRELEGGQLPLLLEKEKQIEELRQQQEQQQQVVANHRRAVNDLRLMMDGTREFVRSLEREYIMGMQEAETRIVEVAKMAEGYSRVLAENRRLYNEVQDLKGNIRVYCRVRPLLGNEVGRNTTIEYCGENGDIMVVHPGKSNSRRTFTFDKVFGMQTTQADVFMDTKPLIRSVLDGFNVCIFAYGQTGSGKTFTMSGPTNAKEGDWGVNYRALNDLFSLGIAREDTVRYEVAVQMLEIYNEQLRDLLSPDSNKKLEIRNNSQQNGLNVPDAQLVPVRSTQDVLELMKIGLKNRAVGATALNERSSRSHSVLTVHVQGKELTRGGMIRGCLHLVDLAGSERLDRSEATGERLKEAQHINKSLSALGDVIAALALKNNHVPFRNSKLTQLLQDSLGGQAKTLMFVHISPDDESYGETISTLKFAERVSSVELGMAKKNQESAELRDLRETVANLKEALQRKDAEIERLSSLQRDSGMAGPSAQPRAKGSAQQPQDRGRRSQNQNSAEPTSAVSRQEDRGQNQAQQPSLERIPSARSRRNVSTVDSNNSMRSEGATPPQQTAVSMNRDRENERMLLRGNSMPSTHVKASSRPSTVMEDSNGSSNSQESSGEDRESSVSDSGFSAEEIVGVAKRMADCSPGEPVASSSPPLQNLPSLPNRRRTRDVVGAMSLQLPRVQEVSFEDWNDENAAVEGTAMGVGGVVGHDVGAGLSMGLVAPSATPASTAKRSRSPGAFLKDPLRESNDDFRGPVLDESPRGLEGRKSPPPREMRPAPLTRDAVPAEVGKLYSKGFVTPPRSARRPVSARASIEVGSGGFERSASAAAAPALSVRSSLQAHDIARARNAGSRLPRPQSATPDSARTVSAPLSSSSSQLPKPPQLARTTSRLICGASSGTTSSSTSGLASGTSFIPVPSRGPGVRRSVQGLAGAGPGGASVSKGGRRMSVSMSSSKSCDEDSSILGTSAAGSPPVSPILPPQCTETMAGC